MNLLDLNADVLCSLFLYVDSGSVFNVLTTCKLFNKIGLERVWKPSLYLNGMGIEKALTKGYDAYFIKYFTIKIEKKINHFIYLSAYVPNPQIFAFLIDALHTHRFYIKPKLFNMICDWYHNYNYNYGAYAKVSLMHQTLRANPSIINAAMTSLYNLESLCEMRKRATRK